MHGGERIELPPLDAVEQLPQLGVAGDRRLEVPPRPRGGDCEHLGRQVAAPAFLERAVALEAGAVLADRVPETVDPLAAQRLGQHDRRLRRRRRERQHLAHVVRGLPRLGMVGLVDRDQVGDLHDPGLERLHRVAGSGHQHEDDGVGDREHADVALAGADRLEEDDVLARGVEQEQRLQRRFRQAARVAARAHRADEDAGVEEMIGEPDPVAEQRPLREGARRIDRDDADRLAEPAHVLDERGDQARLPHAGRSGEPDGVRAARRRVELAHELVRHRVAILDERDRARERRGVALADAGDEALARPAAPAHATDACGSTLSAPRSSNQPTEAPVTITTAAIP